MKPYLAQIKSNLLLMGRDRSVLFFSAVFPLVFFFIFAQSFDAAKSPGAMAQVLAACIIIGVLGNGLFGAGMRTVQDRETNVLRRFKVAPINAAPVLVASLVSGLVNFLPVVLLFLVCGRFVYHTPFPTNTLSLLVFVSIGLLAFRALGMIIAAVVNSAQEGNIIIQLCYLPMLFLSGATFPVSIMPIWLRTIAQFLPATYLHQGVQSIVIGGESLAANGTAIAALILAMAVSLFVGVKLFRWEKEEKIAGKAKFWILAVLAPFFVLGVYQAQTQGNITKTKILARRASRNEALLYTNARIFIGDGNVIENGAVLIRHGKIERVFAQMPADTARLNATAIDISGKTLMPGLIDMHVHLGAPGGVYKDPRAYTDPNATRRRLAAYLYSGIVAVRSTGDWLDQSLKLRSSIESGEYLGAELKACGPLFTAPGGHPTEILNAMPTAMRASGQQQFVRLPKSPDEARQQVDALKEAGVDCTKSVLEDGSTITGHFNHLDPAIYKAVIEESRKEGLLAATHTGDAADVLEAAQAGSNTIEHGSARDEIPVSTLAELKTKNIAYDPTISVIEAIVDGRTGDAHVLSRALLRQTAPAELLAATKEQIEKHGDPSKRAGLQSLLANANRNLLHAYNAGVPLIAGSDAGNMPVIHGPTIQHELQLWVEAGIPASAALQAATRNAARALGMGNRLGMVAPGYDASLIVIDGDPVSDISALDHVSSVLFKGERVNRTGLLEQDKQAQAAIPRRQEEEELQRTEARVASPLCCEISDKT